MVASTVLVGCGRMGSALLAGWLDRGLDPGELTVIEPNEETASAVRQRLGVGVIASAERISAETRPDVVVLAVKPQVMTSVLPTYARFAGPHTVFLSIAAGRTLAFLSRHLGQQAAIVRVMPNSPAAIRRGVSVACANQNASQVHRQRCERLLEAVGNVLWIEDESLLDAVTAVSGSGPAYVFLLVECLAAAGVAAGLPADLSARLARATVSGAGEMLHQSPRRAEDLRRDVTSPGGTTEAALSVLMGPNGLQSLITEAVTAAAERSRHLAG